MNAMNKFLSLFFEELESGLDQVLQNSPLKNSQAMREPAAAIASEAAKILKKEVT